MAGQIATGAIHHLRLTVTDLKRSREFYTELLGFDIAADSPPAGDPSAEAAYQVLWGGCVMIPLPPLPPLTAAFSPAAAS